MTESDLKYWKTVLNGVVPEHLVTPEVVAYVTSKIRCLILWLKRMLIMVMLSIKVVID